MPSAEKDSILTYPFVALWLVAFFGFGNISIFFSFYSHLGEIGIAPAWRPWLLAMEPLTAFMLRPVISPWLNRDNSIHVVRGSLVLIGVALLCYPMATTVPLLFLLRCVHGGAFVTLVSATITLLVGLMSPENSGRMFGIFSLNSLIALAVIPPLADWALPVVGTTGNIYAWASALVIPSLLLMIPARTFMARAPERAAPGRPTLRLIRENLATAGVCRLITANLFTLLTTTVLYYFMNDFGTKIGLANPGYFFSVSMIGTILSRLVGNTVFDKLNQRLLLAASLAVLTASCIAFALFQTPLCFLLIGGVYGTSIGFSSPLLQSLMFRTSAPAMRGLNANLMLSAMDAAYFAGPFIGGTLLSYNMPFSGLFYVAAGCSSMALLGIISGKSLNTTAIAGSNREAR